MEEKYKKLFLVMLDRLGDYQSNAGCNDFDLIKNGNLTEQEAKEIQVEIFNNGVSENLRNNTFTFDFFITQLLENKVKEL